MSQIMRLRVILDTEDDVFRDIEIATDAPLMHFAVLDAFGWEAGELASFSKATSRGAAAKVFTPRHERPMAEDGAKREEAMNESTRPPHSKLGHRAIYVYDFLRMWCFYVQAHTWKTPNPTVPTPPTMRHATCLQAARTATSSKAWTFRAHPRMTPLIGRETPSSTPTSTATTTRTTSAAGNTCPSTIWTT